MTLNELKNEYARLGNQIDALAGEGGSHEARLASLFDELDQVHHQLSELRRRTFGAPTLRDAVTRPVVVALRPLAPPEAAAARPQGVPVALAVTRAVAG
jgi:DNA gyrase/topoisomerase IV subunit A